MEGEIIRWAEAAGRAAAGVTFAPLLSASREVLQISRHGFDATIPFTCD
jgi:hypothetical protein